MINITEETIKTKSSFQVIDITELIENQISKNKIKQGLVTITTKHTTTSIRINEKEPLLLKDIDNYLEELIPRKKDYHHDKIHQRENCPKDEPENAHSHIKAMLMGASETIPIKNGKLNLGTWQRILFIELDGPRERTFSITITSD